MEYNAINLNSWKLVVNAALPYLRIFITQEIFWILLVNGAAIEAYASLNEIPTYAYFNATQSLVPSPHIHTYFPLF